MFRSFALVIFAMLLLAGCKKKEDDIVVKDFGYNYYPADTGRYRDYEVEERTYDDFFVPVKKDTLHYFIRERFDEIFEDEMQRPSFRISRYRRDSDTASWNLTDVWYSTRTSERLEVVEENRRIVKLVFPLRLNKSWDGNAFNDEEENNYFVQSIDQQETIGVFYLDAVVQIIKYDRENLIEKHYATEKYARGIGLVYREEVNVETEIGGEITSGKEITMKLFDYGSN